MKKALSPLVATFILLACAILLGTMVMGWGRDYIEGLSSIEPTGISPSSGLSVESICVGEPLLILQTRYASGELQTAKYLEMKAILTGSAFNSS